jgi:hypothetical protein
MVRPRPACVRDKEKTMKTVATIVLTAAFSMAGMTAPAMAQPSPGATDVYHAHFAKAAPGQAGALSKGLMAPDPSAPMPDHFVVLRHQEGDDWDFVVIQHLGTKAAVDPAPAPADPTRDMRAWHNDTFVSGPSWAEFSRAMGLGQGGRPVYTVSVHRAVPGHRGDLQKALTQPQPAADAKIQTGAVFFQHREGADWTFMTITRHNSWQDFAADRAQAAASPDNAGGWNDIRRYSAFHRDTIADRIAPK